MWLVEMMIHNAQQHPFKQLDFSVSFDQDIEIDFEIVVLCWRQCLQGTQCHVDQRQAMVCFQCSDLPGHNFSQFGQTPFGVLFELVNLALPDIRFFIQKQAIEHCPCAVGIARGIFYGIRNFRN